MPAQQLLIPAMISTAVSFGGFSYFIWLAGRGLDSTIKETSLNAETQRLGIISLAIFITKLLFAAGVHIWFFVSLMAYYQYLRKKIGKAISENQSISGAHGQEKRLLPPY